MGFPREGDTTRLPVQSSSQAPCGPHSRGAALRAEGPRGACELDCTGATGSAPSLPRAARSHRARALSEPPLPLPGRPRRAYPDRREVDAMTLRALCSFPVVLLLAAAPSRAAQCEAVPTLPNLDW